MAGWFNDALQYSSTSIWFFIVHESFNRKLGFFRWVSEYAPGICALRCSQNRCHYFWFTRKGIFHWIFVWLACKNMTSRNICTVVFSYWRWTTKARSGSISDEGLQNHISHFDFQFAVKRWKLLKWVWKHMRIGFDKISTPVQKANILSFFPRFSGLFLH